MSYTTRTTCRVCGSKDLTPLFSLGEQYVSGFVEKHATNEGGKCPIDIELCNDCTLVQAKHTAPQEILYSRHYWYRSGVTDTMRTALRDITRTAERVADLKEGDVVLDIGSNDGTLLRSYCVEGLVKVGVEPATNLAEEGEVGVDVFVNDFWSASRYYDEMGRFNTTDGKPIKAKVITAIGMFYDLEDPNQFIEDVAKALHPDGIFIAQLMCLKNMINLNDVGNLAHEHLEFYSIDSLQYLFGKYGLEIYDLDVNEVNGESYRLYVRHKKNTIYDIPVAVRWAIKQDEGLDDSEFYKAFFKGLEENKKKTREFIEDVVSDDGTVWVYGASTKGNVLLQYYGLDNFLISGAADRSPDKWGKFTIGTGIEIFSESEMRRANPDYLLVLPYTFLDEFIEREKKWVDKGGTFIVPLPEFRIV